MTSLLRNKTIPAIASYKKAIKINFERVPISEIKTFFKKKLNFLQKHKKEKKQRNKNK